MKKLLFTLTISLTFMSMNAQVGIGTNTPVTDLQVEAKSPLASGEHNGVLIPRVASIPTVIAPAGTLIYVTGGATPGFYFSNGTAYINVTDTFAASGPFFESGTTNFASNNTQNVFRTGQTSFGEDLAGPQLYVGSTAIVGSPRTTVGIRNLNTSTANVSTYSLDLFNASSTTNTKYGIRNNVSSSGVGEHVGIENTVFDSGLASTSVTGILNDIGATTGTSSVNYGIRSEIGSSASRGTNYAIYAYSQHGTTTSDPSYSGYFRGDRFAIRNEDDSDGFEMPTVDGTTGQVLTTDGSGNASWQNVNNLEVRAAYSSDTGITNGSTGGNSAVVAWNRINFPEVTATTEYAAGTFTVAVTGLYNISAHLQSTFGSAGNEDFYGIAIYKNGIRVQQSTYRNSQFDDFIRRSVSAMHYLSVGDTIEIYLGFPETFINFNNIESDYSELIIKKID